MSKGQLKRAEAEMKKTMLIFKKNASVIKQSKALARKVATLSPQNMAVAIFSFFVMAASGVHKKGLRNMLESAPNYGVPIFGIKHQQRRKILEKLFPPEMQIDSLPSVMNAHHIEECRKILESESEPLMEEETDPLMEEMAIQIVETGILLEEAVPAGKLNVKKLNQSVKNLKPKKLTIEEQMELRARKFLNHFIERLRSQGIEGNENVVKYLKQLMDAVDRVRIGKGRVEKKNGK